MVDRDTRRSKFVIRGRDLVAGSGCDLGWFEGSLCESWGREDRSVVTKAARRATIDCKRSHSKRGLEMKMSMNMLLRRNLGMPTTLGSASFERGEDHAKKVVWWHIILIGHLYCLSLVHRVECPGRLLPHLTPRLIPLNLPIHQTPSISSTTPSIKLCITLAASRPASNTSA